MKRGIAGLLYALLVSGLLAGTTVAAQERSQGNAVPRAMGCETLSDNRVYPQTKRAITQLQQGIRIFFGNDLSALSGVDSNANKLQLGLSDGKLGAVTHKAAKAMCDQLALLNMAAPGTQTLEIATEFANLDKQSADWRTLISEPQFKTRLLADPKKSLLKLAGPTWLKEQLFRSPEPGSPAPDKSKTECERLTEETLISSSEENRRLTIQGAESVVGALKLEVTAGSSAAIVSQACEALGPADVQTLVATLQHYAQIDQPGALLSRLTDREFIAWWSNLPIQKAQLLLGTPASARVLLSLYQPVNKNAIPSCNKSSDRDFTYYEFRLPEAEQQPVENPDLSVLLGQTYDSPQALADAVGSVLGFGPQSCESAIVQSIVSRDTGDHLNQASRKNLGSSRSSHQANARRNNSGRSGTEAAAKSEITEIAHAASKLAAPIDSPNDSPLDPSQAVSTANESSRKFALTEEAMQELLAVVEDAGLRTQLEALDHFEAGSRREIRQIVENRLTPAQPATGKTQQWPVDEALIAELSARDDLSPAAALDEDTSILLSESLAQISYPSQRLFELSLRSPVASPLRSPGLSESQIAMLVNAARTPVDSNAQRQILPLADSCGCALRRNANGQIYSFHPFWQWPLKDAEDPAPAPNINFAYVDRIAFDGIAIDYGGNDNTGFTIRHAKHWKKAARNFTETAHRYEVKADLTFRLRGWTNWKEDEVGRYASKIVDLLNREAKDNWLPRPGYSATPDGIALLFDVPPMEKAPEQQLNGEVGTKFLCELRNQLQEHQQITIGFDIALDESQTHIRQFANLSRALLADSSQSVKPDADKSRCGATNQAPVDRVLVFLQRPTTDSKKQLRKLIEEMPQFRGINRRDLFRKIVPVVPPMAHQMLGRLDREGNSTDEGEFGQFLDDLVYFRDNFNGIGFWPAAYNGAPDNDYIVGLQQHLREQFSERLYTTAFGFKSETIDTLLDNTLNPVCKLICPNRNALYTTIFWLAVAIVLLLAIGLFSGLPAVIGTLIHYSFGAILLVLLAILLCSHTALLLAPILMLAAAIAWRVYATAVKPDEPVP